LNIIMAISCIALLSVRCKALRDKLSVLSLGFGDAEEEMFAKELGKSAAKPMVVCFAIGQTGTLVAMFALFRGVEFGSETLPRSYAIAHWGAIFLTFMGTIAFGVACVDIVKRRKNPELLGTHLETVTVVLGGGYTLIVPLMFPFFGAKFWGHLLGDSQLLEEAAAIEIHHRFADQVIIAQDACLTAGCLLLRVRMSKAWVILVAALVSYPSILAISGSPNENIQTDVYTVVLLLFLVVFAFGGKYLNEKSERNRWSANRALQYDLDTSTISLAEKNRSLAMLQKFMEVVCGVVRSVRLDPLGEFIEPSEAFTEMFGDAADLFSCAVDDEHGRLRRFMEQCQRAQEGMCEKIDVTMRGTGGAKLECSVCYAKTGLGTALVGITIHRVTDPMTEEEEDTRAFRFSGISSVDTEDLVSLDVVFPVEALSDASSRARLASVAVRLPGSAESESEGADGRSTSSARTFRSTVSVGKVSDGGARLMLTLSKLTLLDFLGTSEAKVAVDWASYEVLPGDLGPRTALASGSYGEVYTSTYAATPVAIKVVKGRDNATCDGADLSLRREVDAWTDLSLRREIGLLLQLRHPHIVVMIGVLRDGPAGLCIVTEFCRGGHVRAFFGKLSPVSAVTIVIQVAQAVTYIHMRSVVHRDIKPENVLLLTKSLTRVHAKLADFGQSKFDTSGTGAKTPHVMGTLAHIAPEVPAGQYGIPADIYALGTCAYECIAGRMPYSTAEIQTAMAKAGAKITLANVRETIQFMANEGRTPDIVPAEAVMPGVAQILRACWNTDVAQRPRAAEVCAHLTDVLKAYTT